MILSVKVTDAMIERYYKYNSGGKKFTQVLFMVLELFMFMLCFYVVGSLSMSVIPSDTYQAFDSHDWRVHYT